MRRVISWRRDISGVEMKLSLIHRRKNDPEMSRVEVLGVGARSTKFPQPLDISG